MKTPTLLTVVLTIALAGSAGNAGALPLTLPTCDMPPLDVACVRLGGIVVGDTTVGSAHAASEAEYNNGTYVFQGTVTADEGGRVEIILADVAFGGSGTPLTILAGGTLVIDGSTLLGTPATLPTILVEDGATIVLRSSDFDAVTLEIHTADADLGSTSTESTFVNAETALRLVDFDGALEGGLFENNTVAIEIDGGAPTLTDIDMFTNDVGIDAEDATFTIARVDIFAIQEIGLRAVRSAGTMNSMAFADSADPPPVGLDIRDTIGAMTLQDSQVFLLGTGMFTCNASVTLINNDFHDNGQDFDDCAS